MSLTAAWKGRAVMVVSPLKCVNLTWPRRRSVAYKPVMLDCVRLPMFRTIDELLGTLIDKNQHPESRDGHCHIHAFLTNRQSKVAHREIEAVRKAQVRSYFRSQHEVGRKNWSYGGNTRYLLRFSVAGANMRARKQLTFHGVRVIFGNGIWNVLRVLERVTLLSSSM